MLQNGPLPARLAALAFPLALLFALPFALLGGCGTGVETQRPSIVLISIDTLRADHMGLYGYERDTTPYLDRFAEESIVFERAFTPAPWTLIAHVTMLTGLYPNQHGVVTGDHAVSPATPFLAERLKRLGYQNVGLYHEGWIHRRHGFDRGFDVFEPHDDAEEAGEHLARALEELDPARPYFLFLHLFDVHSGPLSNKPGPIYDCPAPYDELFLKDAAERIPKLPEGELWLTKGHFDEHALEGLVALYDGGVRYVDDKLGQWLEGMRADGWLDDALVVVTADHGESLGQRGDGIRDHGGAYQEGIRVPLLIRPPRWPIARATVPLRPGERVLDTVHLADVVPTVLDFAGVDLEHETLPGVSLLRPIPSGRAVYGLSPENSEIVVRWPDKYVRLPKLERCIRVDLENDPGELVGNPLTEAEFEAQREAFLAEPRNAREFPAAVPIDSTSEEDAALEELLNKMGYGGGR